MTAASVAEWFRAPPVPATAAPLRAVDVWRASRSDGTLAVTAEVAVRAGDLRGHFPGLPVFPGVFIIEAVGQALALATAPDERPVLRTVPSVRFLAPALVGDELTLDIAALGAGAGTWDVKATATRTDGTVAARMRASFGPSESAPSESGPSESAPPPTPEQPLFDHSRIRAILPQRYPLLLVDQVLEWQPGSFIRAIKAITASEPCFAEVPEGGRHEYPRSLIIESLGQSAALLWLADHPVTPADGRVLMFAGARDIRFEGSAHPGDVLRHDVRLDGVVADTAFASGQTWAGGRRIATVSAMIATRRPIQPIQPGADTSQRGS
jgi:3-hydroxymyristoyl/3-hydroxydecanoyl-(acyl carrier protein) dehydratase